MKSPVQRLSALVIAFLFSTAAWAQQPTVSVNVTGNAMSGTGSAVINLAVLAADNVNAVAFTLTGDPAVLTYEIGRAHV